jgi:RND family efflux transporter MFP subunit
MKITTTITILCNTQSKRSFIVFLAVCIAALTTGCGDKSGGKEPGYNEKPPCKAELFTAKVENAPRLISLSAFTEPFNRTSPGARVMARVTAVSVREGDRVASDRVLARLDTRDLQARHEEAQANLDTATTALKVAQTNLERMRDLHELRIVPLAKLEFVEVAFAQANAAKATAAAMLDEVDVNLSYAVVRAPFSGVVVRKMTEVGNLAAPGQPLFIIEDDSRLRAVAPIGADLASGLSAGESLPVQIGGETVQGIVEGVMPSGEPSAPGLRVQLLIDNARHRFRAGTLAVVQAPLVQRDTPKIMLPKSAVVEHGQLTGAFVVGKDSTARLRWLVLAESRGDMVSVLSGLQAGDRVILSPDAAGVTDGRRVEAKAR